MKEYTVFWIGGNRDGETLGVFTNKNTAIWCAKWFYEKHISDFDPVCGGVGIVDNEGNPVEW